MNKDSKNLIAIAGALATLAIGTPSAVKAMHTQSLSVSPARQEMVASDAAQKAIKAKAERTDLRLYAFVQDNGPTWVEWKNESKFREVAFPLPTLPS